MKIPAKHFDGHEEIVTVETVFSEDAQFWTDEGWSAALNSFDDGCKYCSGKTEAEAIGNLLDSLDFEPQQQLALLL
ncbi:MAG TPA: hypothetical protein VHK27_05505 [Gammaproteobacteria bacterium]|nr:hypothetical protein [Gammaproteobacteria bacterium]